MTKKIYTNVVLIKPTQVLVEGILFNRRGEYYYCHNCKVGMKLQEGKNGTYYAVASSKTSNTIEHNYLKHKCLNRIEAAEKDKEFIIHKQRTQIVGYELNNNPGYTNRTISINNHFSDLTSQTISLCKYDFARSQHLPKNYESTFNYNICMAYERDSFVIYGRPSSLYLLAASSLILEDSTFSIVNNDGQLLIIHSQINMKFVSCLYVKMQSRLESDYLKVFCTIQDMGKRRGLNIFERELSIKGDFEPAVIAMLKHHFNLIHFSGCLFHFIYCIDKNMKHMDVYQYHKLKSFKTMVKRISYMPLLPPEFCSRESLKCIIKQFKGRKNSTESFISKSASFNEFTTYVYNTWFKNPNKVALWNIYNKQNRTNNVCESRHSVMKYNEKSHNSVTSLIQNIQYMMSRDKQNLLNQRVIIHQNEDFEKEKNILIHNLSKTIERDEIFFIDYLDEMIKIFKCQSTGELYELHQSYTQSYFKDLKKSGQKDIVMMNIELYQYQLIVKKKTMPIHLLWLQILKMLLLNHQILENRNLYQNLFMESSKLKMCFNLIQKMILN